MFQARIVIPARPTAVSSKASSRKGATSEVSLMAITSHSSGPIQPRGLKAVMMAGTIHSIPPSTAATPPQRIRFDDDIQPPRISDPAWLATKTTISDVEVKRKGRERD